MSRIIQFVFELQNNIKLYHWMTLSYSRHKAADELIDKISELSDHLIEVYVGKYGRPSMSAKTSNIHLQNLDDKNIIKYLDDSIAFLLRDIPKLLTKDDVDMLNIRDEMVAALNQTKYLFTFV